MISHLWYLFQITDWRHFFLPNGPGRIEHKQFTGWKEPHDSQDYLFAAWYGQISGGYRGLGCFQANCSVSPLVEEGAKYMMEINAEDYFNTFTDPRCRCRIGWHWKCEVHGKWAY